MKRNTYYVMNEHTIQAGKAFVGSELSEDDKKSHDYHRLTLDTAKRWAALPVSPGNMFRINAARNVLELAKP